MAGRRGIVVLPAIAGINDYIRGVSSRFEADGWAVESVDYYSGASAPDLSTPPKIMAAVERLDDRRVLEATAKAVQALQSRGAGAVGVIGFCIGGTYAMLSASQVDGIRAVVNYYGSIRYARIAEHKPVSPLDDAANLRVPMLAHYGTADRFIPRADVDALEAALDGAGRVFELYRYVGAPHAFDEDFRPAYRPVAAREAWQRTSTFLDWYVRPAEPAR
jgi:dienelactone hydrolase